MIHKLRTNMGGNWPVMVTPFNNDKSIDWNSFDRLTDWYVDASVKGLFAVCQSSEMQYLSDEERLDIASRLVKRVGDKLPIIATGTFTEDIEQQALMIDRLYDTGVDAVICLTNFLAGPSDTDDVWGHNCTELLEKTRNIPLGLYECPQPYKRLLSDDAVKMVADSNRFFWYKDTSEDANVVNSRTRLCSLSNLCIYNAHTRSLLETLRAGCSGFTGIAANFYPALFSWLCENFDKQTDVSDQLNQFLGESQTVVDHKYPHSAKQYLCELGVIETPATRLSNQSFERAELDTLKKMRMEAEAWMERLGVIG